MIRFFSITLFIALSASYSTAQITAPKYSNEFLNIGVGARALGMANAQTAVAEDVTAAYWNPAGLNQIQNKYQVALMHSEYFAGIAKYDYAGVTTRMDSQSVIGLSVIRFGVDNIADTRFLYDANGAINYNNIKFFSAADYAFLVSYARKTLWIPGLQFGANAKVIYRSVGQFANAWGFGLDVGAIYDYKKWKFGLMGRDITTTFNAWSHNTALVKDVYAQTGNAIPTNSIEVTLPKLILGIARRFKLPKKLELLTAMDWVNTFDGKRNVLIKTGVFSLDPVVGMELNYKKMVYLRLGAGNIQKVKDFDQSSRTTIQPNFGIGLKINKFHIDYALTDIGNQSDALYSNVFSLKMELK